MGRQARVRCAVESTSDDISARLGATWVSHYSAGARHENAPDAKAFLRELPAIVRGMADCNVVLYQAGADPHVDDPLGGLLTTDELQTRDAIVFETLAERRVPVAWNLAGGYLRDPDGSIPKVLAIHENTLRVALGALWAW